MRINWQWTEGYGSVDAEGVGIVYLVLYTGQFLAGHISGVLCTIRHSKILALNMRKIITNYKKSTSSALVILVNS